MKTNPKKVHAAIDIALTAPFKHAAIFHLITKLIEAEKTLGSNDLFEEVENAKECGRFHTGGHSGRCGGLWESGQKFM